MKNIKNKVIVGKLFLSVNTLNPTKYETFKA